MTDITQPTAEEQIAALTARVGFLEARLVLVEQYHAVLHGREQKAAQASKEMAAKMAADPDAWKFKPPEAGE